MDNLPPTSEECRETERPINEVLHDYDSLRTLVKNYRRVVKNRDKEIEMAYQGFQIEQNETRRILSECLEDATGGRVRREIVVQILAGGIRKAIKSMSPYPRLKEDKNAPPF